MATFHRLLSPVTLSPTRKLQGSTGSHFLSPADSSVSYGSLDGEMIGLALGSPYESPLPPLPPEDRLEENRANCKTPNSISTAQSGSYASTSGVESETPKSIKWRSLGGLFGKKNAVSPGAPLFQVQPCSGDEALEQRRLPQPTLHRIRSNKAQVARAQRPLVLLSQQRQVPQLTPPTKRVQQENYLVQRQPGIRTHRNEVKPAPPSRPKLPRSQTCGMAEHRSKNTVPPPKDVDVKPDIATLKLNGGSLLQVEIPSVQLERYSVMFENLLQPPPSFPLLARRHRPLEEPRSGGETEEKAEPSAEAQNLPSRGRAHSTSPARSPSFSLSLSSSPTRSPSSAQKPPPGGSPLHRSLTSPNLASPKRANIPRPPQISDALEQSHILLVVQSPTDIVATPRPRAPSADVDLWRHSQTSTEASFHTAPESQSTEPVSRPPINQQSLPKRTTSVKGAQPLRSSQSRALPAVSHVIPTSKQNTRGRTLYVQDGEEKRDTSGTTVQASDSILIAQLDHPAPETKPAPPLQVVRNGYFPSALPAVPALVPVAELPKQVGKGAAPLMQDGREHRSGSLPIISPLASHPRSRAPESKFASKDDTRPRVGRADLPVASSPETPLSKPPVSSEDKKASIRSLQQAGPTPTVFSPPPPSNSTIGSPPSKLPPLPSGMKSPEELKSAAEISIARQISISHRQREFLAPVAPQHARQPMQPMIVDVRSGTPVARRSHHLILEHM